MIRLMNSAMMPEEGFYDIQRINAREFAAGLAGNRFVSSIGYENTAREIENIVFRETGKKIQVRVVRDKTVLKSGDTFLVCKLKYRLLDPRDKGRHRPRPEDYEFFSGSFVALPQS